MRKNIGWWESTPKDREDFCVESTIAYCTSWIQIGDIERQGWMTRKSYGQWDGAVLVKDARRSWGWEIKEIPIKELVSGFSIPGIVERMLMSSEDPIPTVPLRLAKQ